jgi:hypothetical protein
VTIRYPIAEAWYPRTWARGTSHRLTARVTPRGPLGELVLYIRVAFLTPANEPVLYPPTGFEQDQQGAFVLTRVVRIGS